MLNENEQDHPRNARQQKAVQLLLSGATVAAVARDLGVDRTTIYNWRRNNPCFSVALNRARSLQTHIITDAIQDLATTAIDTLRELLVSTQVPAAVRLRAAQTVLSLAQRPSAGTEFESQDSTGDLPETAQIPHNSTQFHSIENTPHRRQPIPGHNTPFHCGSGIKFKRSGNPVSVPFQKAA